MKVALVVPSIPKYSETFLSSKINGLIKNGVEVHLMVVGVSPKRDLGIPVYYQPILASKGLFRWSHTLYLILKSILFHPIRSVKLLRISRIEGYSIFGRFRALSMLSNFLKINVDWVHFSYASMAEERSFIGKVIGAKIGVSFRGYDVCIYPLTRSGAYSKTWEHITKVHSISNDLYKAGLKLGLPKGTPYRIITPAIDTSYFDDNQLKDWDGKPRFLTVARLHWKKGIELTLQALSLIKGDFIYTIIGEGEDRERLIFAAHQYGLNNKVRFIGKRSSTEVRQAMASHQYYLQYSLQEGFCNAVLEAQASKMFCIVSNAEGLAENVLHGQTGLVVPKGNVKLFHEAIKGALALENGDKNSMILNASTRVLESFNMNQQEKDFTEFYD